MGTVQHVNLVCVCVCVCACMCACMCACVHAGVLAGMHVYVQCVCANLFWDIILFTCLRTFFFIFKVFTMLFGVNHMKLLSFFFICQDQVV